LESKPFYPKFLSPLKTQPLAFVSISLFQNGIGKGLGWGSEEKDSEKARLAGIRQESKLFGAEGRDVFGGPLLPPGLPIPESCQE